MKTPNVAIVRPQGAYVGQVRRGGDRRWQTVTGQCMTAEAALARAVRVMRREHRSARALWIGKAATCFEPFVALHASRA